MRRSSFLRQPSERDFVASNGASSLTERSGLVATGALWRWAATLAREGAYYQLAIGLLVDTMSVAVGLAMIERVWRTAGGAPKEPWS
jgi:hypothetical protein